ncbi:MAG: NAD(P)/FAD-dependent oxidoreductase [Deinococcota bacterium]
MKTQHYDIIVIGVGMAGLNIAKRTASAGKKVAVIDSRPYGGTCALRGCDPKKVLVGAAELVDWQRRMTGHGVTGDARIDWTELMAFKRTFTEPVPNNLEKSLVKLNVAIYHGSAHFVDRSRLSVGDITLSADHIVIAAGAKPQDLSIPGTEYLITSTDFLELDPLPQRLIFIGGGYISFEFAHIAARADANVTLLHRGERPLEGFDVDLVAQLMTASQDLEINVQVETEVTEVEQVEESFMVTTSMGQSFAADLVVHGAGRVPDIDRLDLDTGGIAHNLKRGIAVSEHLQSVSNPAVYAAGDSADTEGWPLTPVAVHEGLIVASNLLKGNHKTPDYTGTPSVAFTVPALARVGLTEAEAEAQGRSFTVKQGNMSNWYTARRTNEPHAAYKVLIEEETGELLGAHLLSNHAAETINLFALAMRQGLTAHELKTGIFVHPAASSDVSYML